MAVTGVLTSGQWGYPIQGLGCYGGAEEKKPGYMRFTSRQGGARRRGPPGGLPAPDGERARVGSERVRRPRTGLSLSLRRPLRP